MNGGLIQDFQPHGLIQTLPNKFSVDTLQV